LWTRIQSITPSGLVRFLLVPLALAGLLWLITSAFLSLATFVIGIMIAYITLPVVNWLDHFLPSSLAVLPVILGEITFVGLFLAFLIPAVIQQISSFLQSMHITQQAQAYFNQLAQQARTLPEPVRVFLRGWLEQATVNLQHNLSGYIQGLFSAAVRTIFSLLSAFSFLLGLLVIPTWIFAVLNDQRKGRQAVDRLLPDWLRADF
jgi:predicted PurR-regulated permease PerM